MTQAVDYCEQGALAQRIPAHQHGVPVDPLAQLGESEMGRIEVHTAISATTRVPPGPVVTSNRTAKRLVPIRPRPRPVRLWYWPESTCSKFGMPGPSSMEVIAIRRLLVIGTISIRPVLA